MSRAWPFNARSMTSLDMRSMTDLELQNAGPFFETLGYVNLVARQVMAHLKIGGALLRTEVAAGKKIQGLLSF